MLLFLLFIIVICTNISTTNEIPFTAFVLGGRHRGDRRLKPEYIKPKLHRETLQEISPTITCLMCEPAPKT